MKKIRLGILFILVGLLSVVGVFYLKNYFFLQPKEYHAKIELTNEFIVSLLNEKFSELFNYKGEQLGSGSEQEIKETLRLLQDEKYDGIVLHFWASWCDPCIGELPDLISFSQRSKNYKVILVSQDFEQDSLQKFLKVFPAMQTDLFSRLWDKNGVLTTALKIDKLPASIILKSSKPPRIVYGVVEWRTM